MQRDNAHGPVSNLNFVPGIKRWLYVFNVAVSVGLNNVCLSVASILCSAEVEKKVSVMLVSETWLPLMMSSSASVTTSVESSGIWYCVAASVEVPPCSIRLRGGSVESMMSADEVDILATDEDVGVVSVNAAVSVEISVRPVVTSTSMSSKSVWVSFDVSKTSRPSVVC